MQFYWWTDRRKSSGPTHLAEDLTLGLALTDYVKQRRLPRPAWAHHGAHVAREDRPRHLRTKRRGECQVKGDEERNYFWDVKKKKGVD